eukprot:g8133.t1
MITRGYQTYGSDKQPGAAQRWEDDDTDEETAGLQPAPSRPSTAAGDPGGDEVYSSRSRLRRGQQRGAGRYESLDFEPFENQVQMNDAFQRAHSDGRQSFWKSGKTRALRRWILTFVIGIGTAGVAVFISYGFETLSHLKYKAVDTLIERERRQCPQGYSRSSSGCFGWVAFPVYVCINLIFCLVAAAFVVTVEPAAAGSGIPEIKCVLNGVNLPKAVRFRTLVAKACGVMFAVAGSLPVGKEGPMIHSGAVAAAAISQGKSYMLGFDTSFTKFADFRNDREKRDFIVCGAAAGVAAAFGAPVGGVLFALEEGCSFWYPSLTWRAFFCAMMSTFTLFLIANFDTSIDKSAMGNEKQSAMFSFGRFRQFHIDRANFAVYELLIFVGMGIAGGLIGATYNGVNRRLTQWRMRNSTTPARKFLEVAVISVSVSSVCFLLPYLFGQCSPRPQAGSDWSNEEKDLLDELVSFYCEDGEYNEAASLSLTESEIAIKQLFHFRDQDVGAFKTTTLLLFAVPYLFLACWTYGLSVPSGLFVPCLLSGAAFGRLCGHELHQMSPDAFADPGTYALIGAAAMLGGMARMTISICVILLEATGDVQYGLPLMLTLMPARWVGNVFNEGLYDIHIHLKKVPFLEYKPPESSEHQIVRHVMAREPRVLKRVERVSVIYRMLLNTTHECFPVVRADPEAGEGGAAQPADEAPADGAQASDRTLEGTILRKTLCVLLQRGMFSGWRTGTSESMLSWSELETIYPRFPRIEDIKLSSADYDCWMNLTPYINCSPYTISEVASVPRCYRLFRGLGLRCLVVVDKVNQVAGMITRKDLLLDHHDDDHDQRPAPQFEMSPMRR